MMSATTIEYPPVYDQLKEAVERKLSFVKQLDKSVRKELANEMGACFINGDAELDHFLNALEKRAIA